MRLAIAALPRLAVIGFSYSQPLLINRIIDFINDSSTTTSSNEGYGLIGATALVYIGLTVCQATGKFTSMSDLLCRSRMSFTSIRYSSSL